MSQQSLESHKSQDYMHRFLGGPPLAVAGRLILLSILVGVVLTAVGLDPWNIIDSVRDLIVHVWNMGFDTFRWLWRYFLLGAAVVVPIWLVPLKAMCSNMWARPDWPCGSSAEPASTRV